MSVAGMMTPVRRESFQNLQLNAGAFLVGANALDLSDAHALRTSIQTLLDDYVYNNESTASEYSGGAVVSTFDKDCILGITRGGGSFVVNSEHRQAEADGVRYRFVGDTFVDSIDAQISGTLIEVFPGNIKRLLGSADITHTANSYKWKVSQRTRINKVTDYIRYLYWVGDLADGRLVAIKFDYAINTAGMTMTFTDKGEATIPFEFHAVQASVEDYDKAPFQIVFVDDTISGVSVLFDGSELTLSPEFDKTVTSYAAVTGAVSGGESLTVSIDDGYDVTFTITADGETYAVDSTCLFENGYGFNLDILASGDPTEGTTGITAVALPFTVKVHAKNPAITYNIGLTTT